MHDEMKKYSSIVTLGGSFPLAIAGKPTQRMAGLLKRRKKGSVLMIAPCKSIHTFGMTKPIRVAFFDATGTVLDVGILEPCRLMKCRKAEGVLEQVVDASSRDDLWFKPGDKLSLAA